MTAIIADPQTIVGVVCDRHMVDGVDLDVARARYLEALRSTAGVVPVLIPVGLSDRELQVCLSRFNGLLLTGAVSNVSPSWYGGAEASTNSLDLERDATSIVGIRIALALGIPLLGICRGLQELNVALGGTLSTDISEGDGRVLHVEDLSLPRDLQYAPTHAVLPEGDGPIAKCIRRLNRDSVRVNTLHQQGIAQLAEGLCVDARCVDGVVEAVSVKGSSVFAAAVQWHPEWFHADDPLSGEIFHTFGEACRLHSMGTKL